MIFFEYNDQPSDQLQELIRNYLAERVGADLIEQCDIDKIYSRCIDFWDFLSKAFYLTEYYLGGIECVGVKEKYHIDTTTVKMCVDEFVREYEEDCKKE